MPEPLEDKYSRFERNTGIDLQAEIAAGGSDGGLDNYYTKEQSDLITDDLDDRVIVLENSAGPDLTDFYDKTETDELLADKADGSTLTTHVGNTNNPHSVTKSQVGLANADNTSDINKPISTAAQTALDGKANSVHTHAAGDIGSGVLNIGRIPTGTSGTTVSLGNHSHTKADVGLSNVDNTSDTNKPVSTAVQTALDAKSDTSHNHDSRYYTETETDTLLSAKSNTSHTHTSNEVYISAGTTTALGTTLTTIAGLDLSLAVGTYEIKAWVPFVNVVNPTSTDFRLVDSAGLITSSSSYRIARYSTTYNFVAQTALNPGTLPSFAGTILATMDGIFTVTTSGVLLFQAARTGGTSQTSQSFAYVTAKKLA